MKAWRVDEVGDPASSLHLQDVEAPEPGPGEILIRVEACTMNFADILLCQGVYQDRPMLPFTLGLDGCGIVEACGEGVEVALGSRVAGMSALPAGAYAEKALLRAATVIEMPLDIPASDAVTLYSTYQTSYVGLHHRVHLAKGETLLVLGAAGGVGSAAVQLGVAAGATVIAVVGGDPKAKVCQELGAHHVIDHRSHEMRTEVLRLTGKRGVDVVYDPVGGVAGQQACRLLTWEGRYLVIGFASGEIPSYAANHILVKNYSVVGLHWSAYVEHGGRAVIDAAHHELMGLYRAGLIRPLIDEVVDLHDVPVGLSRLRDRTVTGRLILSPSSNSK